MTTIIATPQRAFSPGRLVAAAAVALIVLAVSKAVPQAATSGAPETLQDTGLYSDFAALQVDDTHLAFSPQYPLWTDGAAKRRWISLPPGTAIDASDPDAWSFPVGTRLWKEFSFAGQRVETRFMERRPDGWLYAAYAWSADGRETQRVSARGRRGAHPLEGGRSHAIPGVTDCKVCHQGGRSEVLGFSAIQLSPQRDPDALHADASSGIDLDALAERGLLVGLPASRREAPRIGAASALERTALGYLHGNCGHCHNEQGPLRNVGLLRAHLAGRRLLRLFLLLLLLRLGGGRRLLGNGVACAQRRAAQQRQNEGTGPQIAWHVALLRRQHAAAGHCSRCARTRRLLRGAINPRT